MSGLSPATLRVARSVARTLFDPGTGTPVPDARLDWTTTELADYATKAGPRTSNGLRLIFLGLQLLPLFVIGKFARFTSLGFEDQLRYLRKVELSRLLAPLLATAKIVLSIVYFEHPDVLAEAGVHPTCMLPSNNEPIAWKQPEVSR
ncbi:MAG: hypothetical protein JST54_27190 [Deltaproteobacteria bacterium]|nr:hypothetical protein [Deltaproteobacteria bacterium]